MFVERWERPNGRVVGQLLLQVAAGERHIMSVTQDGCSACPSRVGVVFNHHCYSSLQRWWSKSIPMDAGDAGQLNGWQPPATWTTHWNYVRWPRLRPWIDCFVGDANRMIAGREQPWFFIASRRINRRIGRERFCKQRVTCSRIKQRAMTMKSIGSHNADETMHSRCGWCKVLVRRVPRRKVYWMKINAINVPSRTVKFPTRHC